MNEADIFISALEITEAHARDSYLDRVCAGNSQLRKQVEELLVSHFKSGEFLNIPAAEQLRAQAPASKMAHLSSVELPADTASDDLAEVLKYLFPSEQTDALGRLGHYEVLQVLGQGGFGIVFRAFDAVLQRVVAIKVLIPQFAATSPARKRFLREARTSAQVRHENVVYVYEVAEQPLPYLVMEFIPGETLQQRLERTGPLEVPEVLRIGRQIAAGLAAAHATGLIHRDIKPGNVLLEGAESKVKITDFGLARATDDASVTHSGMLAGTPMYMAPEQAIGQTLDQRADLFSLGSVLYQMVTGRPPFRASNTVAVLKRVAEETPRAIREITPETPSWLCAIITKLHAKNPDDRYQSAREVADVFADCEQQLKVHSRLTDYSRIPNRRQGGKKPLAVLAALSSLVLIFLIILTGEFTGGTHFLRFTKLFSPPSNPIRDSQTQPSSAEAGTNKQQAQTLIDSATQDQILAVRNLIGMEFVLIPRGQSWLGGGNGQVGYKEVEFATDFYLGKYEVTQAEWKSIMETTPSHFAQGSFGEKDVQNIPQPELDRFPVEGVSWHECQEFVDRLNRHDATPGWTYRLPTSIEWEYACRGGPMSNIADSAYDFYLESPTNELTGTHANLYYLLQRTCKVGSYSPNRLGLFDLHGNVWEWCDDIVHGEQGLERATRGGCWTTGANFCYAGLNFSEAQDNKSPLRGFRIARVPVDMPSPRFRNAPFTTADVERIAALPAVQQIQEIRDNLMRLNPEFDGQIVPRIEENVVVGLRFRSYAVTDLSPLQALKGLKSLVCDAEYGKTGAVSNLAPLKGLPLQELWLNYNPITDLGPLTGMPLTDLRLYVCPHITDLSPLKGMSLTRLDIGSTGVIDLSPLEGMPVTWLNLWSCPVENLESLRDMPLSFVNLVFTNVSDLGPLKGTHLNEIHLQPEKIRGDLEMLRTVPGLQVIGTSEKSRSAAEFWADYDQKRQSVADQPAP